MTFALITNVVVHRNTVARKFMKFLFRNEANTIRGLGLRPCSFLVNLSDVKFSNLGSRSLIQHRQWKPFYMSTKNRDTAA